MTDSEYSQFRTALEDVFISLYIIDAGSLTPDQRKSHQAALSAAYLAVVRAENAALADLSAAGKKKLDALAASTSALQKQLSGLKKATEVLTLVGGALDVFAGIAKLFK